jgi:hypothetical protein
MNGRDVAAFVLGGLVYLMLQPLLAQLALIGAVLLVLMLVVFLLLPGGWLLFYGFRTFSRPLGRYVAPVVLVVFSALLVLGVSLAAGQAAGMFLGFVVGGFTGLLLHRRLSNPSSPKNVYMPSKTRRGKALDTSPPRPASVVDAPPRGDVPVVYVSKGLLGRSKGCLHAQAFRNGVIVFGEASIPVVRTLVKGALDTGHRVVVIGSPYMAAPCDGTRLVKLGRTSFNILRANFSDRFQLRKWAENIAVPLVVSTGLDTAEAGMVIRFLEKFGGSRIVPDDIDKLVAEYGPTSSARLKDALGMVTTFFGEGYPEPEKLFGGGWRQLVVDTRALSQASQLFIGMYLLYEAPRLFPGCVLVFDSAELGIPEQQVLPYDARHVWLRTLKAVERLRETGFIMSSSTGLLAPELLDIADTYVVTKGSTHVRRELSERIGVDINTSSIPVGWAVVFTRATPDGRSHLFEGEVIQTPACDMEALEAEAERAVSLLREEMLGASRDTLLYAEFADLAETCYSVLRAVKRMQSPTADTVSTAVPDGGKAVKTLLEKQYLLVDPSGVLGLTALGEQALRDWETKMRKGVETGSTASASGGETQQAPLAVQAGLNAFSGGSNGLEQGYADVERLVSRARQHLLRGDSLTAVGTAYKAAVTALKRFTGVDKGHLPELAEKAVEKGVLKLSEEEARRLYAANIESKRLIKQAADGQAVSDDDRKRMADAAELLISLAERIVAFSESIGFDNVLSDEGEEDG